MRILIPVTGGAFVLIALVVFGLVIRAVISSGASTPPVVVSASAPSSASSVPTPRRVDTTIPITKSTKPCVYRGPRKRLVVGASKDVPIELWSAPDEALLAAGFAARNHTGLGFVLDPKTLSPQRSYSKKVADPLKRVVPLRSNTTIKFETNVDDPTSSVRNTLTVPTDPPIRLGTFKSALTLGFEGESVPEILWKLPFHDPIDAMHAVAIPSKGLGVVFRAKSSLWLGWVNEDHKPIGALHKIPETGIKVGTPSVGWNGQDALITFANLETAKAPWTIRLAKVDFGQPPKVSFEWAVPKGGPGGAAIAPSIRGIHDGRWLMVWTEGKSGSRSVRVQTYDADMLPLGDAFTVSKPGSNAGQGTAAVGKDGGAVLYLAVMGKQYEVWGAGIECQ